MLRGPVQQEALTWWPGRASQEQGQSNKAGAGDSERLAGSHCPPPSHSLPPEVSSQFLGCPLVSPRHLASLLAANAHVHTEQRG